MEETHRKKAQTTQKATFTYTHVNNDTFKRATLMIKTHNCLALVYFKIAVNTKYMNFLLLLTK